MTNKNSSYAAYMASDFSLARAPKRSKHAPMVCAVLAGGLMLGHLMARPSLDAMQQAVVDFMAPAFVVAQAPLMGIHQKIEALYAWSTVKDENEALRVENERLKAWYQAALMLQSENKALRDLLNVDRHDAQSFITTRVIADGSSSYARSLVIEGGRNGGILKGQGVLSHDGLIGRVIEAGVKTSRVLLLQDINSRIPVLIEGTEEKAILAGTNGPRPILDHVAANNTIKSGQRIITSGLGGLFPYGIPVGETIVNGDGTISVALFADPEQSQHIQVVDYGMRPLIGDPSISAASADRPQDNLEAN